MIAENIQPSLKKEAFKCPRCSVLCPHKHFVVDRTRVRPDFDINIIEIKSDQKKFIGKGPNFIKERRRPWDFYITLCTHCNEYAIWENQNIIFPNKTTIDEASPDMPNEVKSIYEEAQLIYKNSPRASAALLRLAIETLIPKLDYEIKEDKLFNGPSFVDELYIKNEAEEAEISETFYKEYKSIRQSLYQQLVENNENIYEIILFEKTQKIFRSIYFCHILFIRYFKTFSIVSIAYPFPLPNSLF